MLKTLMTSTLAAGVAVVANIAAAENYPTPLPLQEGAQAPIDAISATNDTFRIAYMPPATEPPPMETLVGSALNALDSCAKSAMSLSVFTTRAA